jgi:cephalosporin-C deacetylase
VTAPPDFERFWGQTLMALAGVPAAPEIESRRVLGDGLMLDLVSFSSLGDARIRGYGLRWNDGRSRPLVVHAHGYGDRSVPMRDWARRGLDVFGVDFRGFGRSSQALPAASRWGWLLSGAQTPESSVIRGAVCDYLRMVEVARGLTRTAAVRVVLHGVSLAGGIALMAEALTGSADLLVVQTPTFGWSEGRRFFVERGSGAEVNHFLAAHPNFPEEDLMVVLSYFDAVNFADRLRCPTLFGVGRVDQVVPAPTVRAIYERVLARCEVMEFPIGHAAGPEAAQWERFDDRWLALAVGGVPADFGRPAPAVAR